MLKKKNKKKKNAKTRNNLKAFYIVLWIPHLNKGNDFERQILFTNVVTEAI